VSEPGWKQVCTGDCSVACTSCGEAGEVIDAKDARILELEGALTEARASMPLASWAIDYAVVDKLFERIDTVLGKAEGV